MLNYLEAYWAPLSCNDDQMVTIPVYTLTLAVIEMMVLLGKVVDLNPLHETAGFALKQN